VIGIRNADEVEKEPRNVQVWLALVSGGPTMHAALYIVKYLFKLLV
jgi:hypothetical protein